MKCKFYVLIVQIILCTMCTVNVYSVNVQCVELIMCTFYPDSVVCNVYSQCELSVQIKVCTMCIVNMYNIGVQCVEFMLCTVCLDMLCTMCTVNVYSVRVQC